MKQADKTELRVRMKALRAELSARDPDAGEALADIFPEKLLQRYGPVVASYLPIGSEIDSRPLMQRLNRQGIQMALPCLQADGSLIFRAYRTGDMLEKGKFGLLEPNDKVPEVQPTLILTPLLAFDGLGHRLGYGQGCYDQSLARLRNQGRVFACGLAFQNQQIETVPAEPHDVPLDWVVTERGSIPIFMMRTLQAGKNANS